ncbi:MAG: hypothetical protein JWO36_5400 [Myxococcales bacterium]|nr:hypothetical protein [Myxococcales bacterium]
MTRLVVIIASIATLSSTSSADKAASLDYYGKAKRAYAAEKFAVAIEELEHAYREFPAPEYLHDIAQALRRLDRCAEAVGYFERFLAEMPAAPNRVRVEAQLVELRAQCPAEPAVVEAAATAPPPPISLMSTVAPANDLRPATSTTWTTPARTSVAHVVGERRPSWNADITAGVLGLSAGAVVTPPVMQLRAGASYETRLPGHVHVGAAFDLARLPYDDIAMGTAWFGGPQLVVGAEYPLAAKFAVIAELGLGVRFMWGLEAGNPLVADGHAASAIALALIRAEVGISWQAADRLSIRVLPLAIQYSPARSPLATDIGSLHGLGMLVGLGVAL